MNLCDPPPLRSFEKKFTSKHTQPPLEGISVREFGGFTSTQCRKISWTPTTPGNISEEGVARKNGTPIHQRVEAHTRRMCAHKRRKRSKTVAGYET